MSLVSNNIKSLRKLYRYTQEQLAERIGIKRSLLGAYEEGRADPRLNNLLKIGEIFGVLVDDLISQDLSGMTEEKWEKYSGRTKGPNTRFKVLSITVDQDNRENIELVPQKAAAGYLNGYGDPEYLEELPKFKLPILAEDATYRAFEISGDSMLPVQPGSIIIGKYVETLDYIMDGKTYILVTSREGVVYKRVFNKIKEEGKILLISDNKVYSPYEVVPEEILEIWEAKAYLSIQFPTPRSESDMTVEKLAAIVMDLQQEVIRLKERK